MSTTSTSLRILRVTALLGYMMGSSMLLFARARDGALLLSSILYRINSFTGMPVNTVWFVIVMAGLLGLLVCAGAGAIDAISTVSITALYVAYAIPMFARFAFDNDFKPGPFNLGFFVGVRSDGIPLVLSYIATDERSSTVSFK
ncbi:hypothetical protein EDD16DRAFT_1707334 [Pisolithus croceorrhizus]|nr:hypothetical protein EDD16DRAFT_1707334 [Pisolithus croceorrhizus]KAI6135387.1 hypothetical protein EV401DRAFT_2063055 [Pisolithus croceorrhizus]